MTLEGETPLSVNERVGIFLAGVVSFISIMCTVWYAAIAVNNLTHAISQANTNITRIERVVTNTASDFQEIKVKVDLNALEITKLKSSSTGLSFIGDNFVLLESGNGEKVKLAIYVTDAEGKKKGG